jgi:hypothetical protein
VRNEKKAGGRVVVHHCQCSCLTPLGCEGAGYALQSTEFLHEVIEQSVAHTIHVLERGACDMMRLRSRSLGRVAQHRQATPSQADAKKHKTIPQRHRNTMRSCSRCSNLNRRDARCSHFSIWTRHWTCGGSLYLVCAATGVKYFRNAHSVVVVIPPCVQHRKVIACPSFI